MQNQLKQAHQLHLDSLRGLAATIVVITHYVGAFFPFSAFANQGSYRQKYIFESLFFYPPFGLMIAGQLAVCLFFILSGYVLSYNYLGEPRNIKKLLIAIIKRPIRLGGVVLCTVILSACLWYSELYFNVPVADVSSSTPWFSDLWKGQFVLQDFLINIGSALFGSAEIYNISLWTIQVELYGSILVFLTLLISSNFKYRWVIFSLFIIVFIKSFYQGFFLGMLIADLVKNKPFRLSVRLKNTMAGLLALAFFYFGSYPHYANVEYLSTTVYKILPEDTDYEGGYPMLAALFLFCHICLNDKLKELLCMDLFQYLGKVSYGVYGVHLLVIGSISSWLFLSLLAHVGYIYAFIIVFLSGLMIILFLGHLITLYIDKPVIRLANYAGKNFVEYFYRLFLRFKKG